MMQKDLICAGALFLSVALHDAIAGREKFPSLEEAPTQNSITQRLIALENEINDWRGSYNEENDLYTDDLLFDVLVRDASFFWKENCYRYSMLCQYQRKIEELETQKSKLDALLKILPFQKERGESNGDF